MKIILSLLSLSYGSNHSLKDFLIFFLKKRNKNILSIIIPNENKVLRKVKSKGYFLIISSIIFIILKMKMLKKLIEISIFVKFKLDKTYSVFLLLLSIISRIL